jgi:hypothetical protein
MMLPTDPEAVLTAAAKTRRSNRSRWWGIRGGGTRKAVMCYICNSDIPGSSFSARYPRTKQSVAAVEAHLASHTEIPSVRGECLAGIDPPATDNPIATQRGKGYP